MSSRAFVLCCAVTAVWVAWTCGPPVLAQTRDCEATRKAWESDPHMPKGCTCPPGCNTCTPQCPSTFSGGTFAGTPNAFAAQMAGSLISGLFAAAFAPIEFDESAIEAQLAAEEEASEQAEALNKKFLADWQAFQEHAARAHATEKTRAEDSGAELLGRMHGVADAGAAPPPPGPQPTGGIEGFKWETPPAGGVEFAPLSTATYDTSGLKDWQRALCAAYLSQTALSIADAEPDRARYYSEQAARAMTGKPLEVRCSFPTMTGLPEPGRPDPSALADGPPMAEIVEVLKLVHMRARDLQGIDLELRDKHVEKQDAEADRRQADAAVAEAQAAKERAGTSDPALMAEIQRRLDEALRQREEANSRLEALVWEIEDLNERKESIRQELEAARQRVQTGGAAG